jgi:hypothetical protein
MSDPTINLELAMPILGTEKGWAVHVSVIGEGYRPCTEWRQSFEEAVADRNNLIDALEREAA